MGLFCFLCEPTVVRKANTSTEADQQVIHPKHTARPGTEEGEDEVEHEEAFAIDEAPSLGESDSMSTSVADKDTIDSAENTLVQDRITGPVEDNLAGVKVIS